MSMMSAPSLDHTLCLRDGALRIDETAAVGEGIRRDVEHAHDQGAP